MQISKLPSLRKCSLHLPRTVSASDVSLLTSSSHIGAKGPPPFSSRLLRLWHSFYPVPSFIAVRCISRGDAAFSAFHKNPRDVLATAGCWCFAGTIVCYITRCPSGSFKEKSIWAFVWFFNCFSSAHHCNTLQTRPSLCDLCIAIVSVLKSGERHYVWPIFTVLH